MKNRKAKFMSVLLSLSMLGTAPVYAEEADFVSDNDSSIVAYEENPEEDFQAQPFTSECENGHTYVYADQAENGLLSATCSVCGYQQTFSVPVEMDVLKKDDSHINYRDMDEQYLMDVGQTADIAWISYYSSANSDYEKYSNWKITSSDESVVSVEQTGSNSATITSKKAGMATLTIQEQNNPSLVFTSNIYVNAISEESANWYFTSSVFFYDGEEHKAAIYIRLGDKVLTEGTDYELHFDGDLVNAGTVNMTIVGIGDYTGSIETSYKIQRNSLNSATFTVDPAYYTGSEVTPDVTVAYQGRLLVKDRDYTLDYANNIELGTARVGIQGIGNYEGYVTTGFKIQPANISSFTAELSEDQFTYDGNTHKPDVTVKNGDKELTYGTDYSVSYPNNRAVGTATINIYGRGNYTGSLTKDFQIVPADIQNADISLDQDSFDYDGTEKEQRSIQVSREGVSLREYMDYTVSYINNVDAGTASVVISGMGNYTGTATKDFTIKPLNLNTYSVSLSQSDYEYDGTEKCPDVTVSAGGRVLEAGKDFTISYENNINAGTASVIISGIGNYTGSTTVNFTITEKSSGKDDSDSGNTGKDDSDKGDSGKEDSGKDDSSKDDSGKDDSGKDDSSKDDSGKDDSNKDDSGKDDSSKDDSGKDDSSKDDSGKDDSDKNDSGKEDSSKDDSGKDDSGKDDSSKDDSGKDDSSKDDSGKDDSSKDDSSKDNSSKDDSNKDNSNKDDSSKNDSSENGSNNNSGNSSNSGNNDSNNSNNNNSGSNNSSDNSSAEVTPIPTEITVTNRTLTQSKKKTNLTVGIVTDGKITLKSSNSKIVKISGTQVIPVAPGKATVTITVAKGEKYTAATKKITITVIPVGTSVRSLKSKSKKTAVVTWKTVNSISGYQISYSQKSNMKKAKTITVKSSAKTATLKKLVSKKKYYVRIRTYKVVKGKKYYSNWSTIKSVKVK